MPFETVTVAVDLDAPSHVALAYARSFFRPFNTALEVVHVTNGDTDIALSRLTKWMESVGVDAKRKILGGRAAETIVDYMPSADLTVVGTHRRSGLAGFFLGSVAEKIVRAATRPVLVVPENIDRTVPPVKILVAVDFSETSMSAYSVGTSLGAVMKSDVIVLSVIEDVTNLSDPPSGEPEPGGAVELYRDSVRENTEMAMAELIRARTDILADIRFAHPVDGICAAAEQHAVDLIVMGTRGLSGLAHFGSVAERTLRRAPCPVLVIHEGHAASSTNDLEPSL
jgi:nucleotide-binding universal stress UspA family protein